MISWIATALAFAIILGALVAQGEPCSGSTMQRVATIARVGSQPGLVAFLYAECRMADGIRSLLPSAQGEEIAPVSQGLIGTESAGSKPLFLL
jgi:hypothetical protein